MKTHTLHFLLGGAFFALICSVSAQDPRLIDVDNLEKLNAIRYDLDGDGIADETTDEADYNAAFGTVSCPDGCEGYELTANLDFNDIDGSGTASKWANPEAGGTVEGGWEPIGEGPTDENWGGEAFSATFDGNGHTISNFYVDRKTIYIALFNANEGTIRNLGLEDVSLLSRSTEDFFLPKLASIVSVNDGMIRNCYATGSIWYKSRAECPIVGGLVARNNETIIYCHTSVSILSSGDEALVGGLVGHNAGPTEGKIIACYATGRVKLTVKSAYSYAGGLVGFNGEYQGYYGSYSTENRARIIACYATGSVTAPTAMKPALGGLVGVAENSIIISCYATGEVEDQGVDSAGLIGNAGGLSDTNVSVSNSYYDSETSGQSKLIGRDREEESDVSNSSGKTTSELQTPTSYTGIYATWNDIEDETGIEDPWDFGTSSEYPTLKPSETGGNATTGGGDTTGGGGTNGGNTGSGNGTGSNPGGATPQDFIDAFAVPSAPSGIVAHPNPTSGRLYVKGISSADTYTYTLYTLIGQKVRSGSMGSDAIIDLSRLAEGQYLLLLKKDGGDILRTRLLVKKK